MQEGFFYLKLLFSLSKELVTKNRQQTFVSQEQLLLSHDVFTIHL